MTNDQLKVSFILVNPARPENIGAAARALKTMGFTVLRLVNPTDHLSAKAHRLAHGATDLLEAAQVFDSLEAAINDSDLIIGTSAKRKHSHRDYHTPEHLLEVLRNKIGTVREIALVFGSEESGLSKADLRHCHLVSTIPMAVAYPSLNLAQAVMVYAFVFAPLVAGESTLELAQVSSDEWKILYHKASRLLDQIGIPPESQLHGRMLERLSVSGRDDIHLLLSFLGKIEPKLKPA